jgi:hypothetical protein
MGEARRLVASWAFGCARARGAATPLACGIAILLWSGLAVSPAWAGYEQVSTFPQVPEEEPLGALPLVPGSTGVATDDATGEVYVTDGIHARVVRLSSEGRFLGTWGWNVISTGPGKAGTSLEEVVEIERTSGGQDVVYKGEGSETQPLSYEAEATVVEKALGELVVGSEREGPIKGGIKVIKEGAGAYRFTYEGALGDELSGPISVAKEGLEGTIETKIKQGSPAFEDCVVAEGDICRKPDPFGTEGGNPGEFFSPKSVAIDQKNGDVYVLDPSGHLNNAVQVFTANGERTGIEFGESTTEKLGKVPESEKSPEKLREATDIAVDPEGDSYVVNSGTSHKEESRISVFNAKGEYIEALGRTCGAGFEKGCGLSQVAVDFSGNVYTLGEEDGVYEFQRGSKRNEPVCSLPKSILNLEALAVDESGEVVVYDNGKGVDKFYWFAACEGGQFSEEPLRDFENKAEPPAVRTTALAWNPTLHYPATHQGYERPKGVFYAIDPAYKNPVNESNTGFVFAQEEEPIEARRPPPKIVEESVLGVGLTYATLNARIEPYSDPVHYHFSYYSPEDLKCSQLHECEAPMGVEPQLRAGDEVVSEPVSGLVPGATYYFRVAGYSFCNPEAPKEECGLEGGVERKFTTFSEGSAGLPDGRAYELVSPPLKGGEEVLPPDENSMDCDECLPGAGDEKFPMQTTPDGEEIVYEGGPFSTTGAAVNENEYLATRSPGGWATRDLSPATVVRDGRLAGYKVFSPDLSLGVLVQEGEGPSLSPEAPQQSGSAAYPDVYLQSMSSPDDPRPVWTREDFQLSPPHRGPEGADAEELRFEVGGLAGGHVIVAANDALTPATPPTAPAAVDGGAEADNLYDWAEGRLRLVNVLPGNKSTQPGASFGSGMELETSAVDPDYVHAISVDGSRIFWTDSENHRVYVRIEGKETIEVPDAGKFLTASADGSKVLLNDGHIYDLETGKESTVDLTDEKGGFQGILGASDDLSKVYFVDTEELPGVQSNAYGGKAAKGDDNLYLWQEGSPARYIATLTAGDNDNGDVLNLVASKTGDWAASPSDRTAQVTSDGGYAAFMSKANLTGYGSPAADSVFEYDAKSNTLVCASCNPTKEQSAGASSLSLIKPGSGFMAQPSNLLENGRLFFDSDDALSPRDQHPGVENVYEYEPDGLEDSDGLVPCQQVGGCVFMISSGTSEADSSFVNATLSGSDVFFTTRSRLVPQDQDDLMDLYDAREDGGFATEVPAKACTESETCQGPSSSPPPTTGTSLSAPLSGLGNIVAPPQPSPRPSSFSRPPTQAQLLAKALRACHRARVSHAKRLACEKKARRRYGRPESGTSRVKTKRKG